MTLEEAFRRTMRDDPHSLNACISTAHVQDGTYGMVVIFQPPDHGPVSFAVDGDKVTLLTEPVKP